MAAEVRDPADASRVDPGVYVCGLSAAGFGAIGYLMAGQRGGSFRYGADQLEDAIRAALPD